MNAHSEIAARTIEISRLIDAPRALVFEVFTNPKHIDAWWGPEGFRNETHAMKFEQGGLWHYTMHGPDGKDWPNWIKYNTIIPNEKLAYDHGGELNEPAHFSGEIRFADEAGKTRVTLCLLLPSVEDKEAKVKFGAVQGGEQTLARLDKYVMSQART
jgi:uncharacterized protein YndB with AHSA1/START domain